MGRLSFGGGGVDVVSIDLVDLQQGRTFERTMSV